jgi:hypothetical protein
MEPAAAAGRSRRAGSADARFSAPVSLSEGAAPAAPTASLPGPTAPLPGPPAPLPVLGARRSALVTGQPEAA